MKVKAIITAAIVGVALLCATAARADLPPYYYAPSTLHYWVDRLGLPNMNALCVNNSDLHSYPGHLIYGDYDPYSGVLRLSSTLVCWPLTAWFATYEVPASDPNPPPYAPVTRQVLEAMVTVAHEDAHSKGIRNEASAECQGVKGAFTMLRYYGVSAAEFAFARYVLLNFDEKHARPPAYRLANVHCNVTNDYP
jgi:hypothetical protein